MALRRITKHHPSCSLSLSGPTIHRKPPEFTGIHRNPPENNKKPPESTGNHTGNHRKPNRKQKPESTGNLGLGFRVRV